MTTPPLDLEAAARRWRQQWGESQVDDAGQAQRRYGRDTTGAERRLLGAVRATGQAQVVEVMRTAHELGLAVHPISTGKNWGYGSALPAGHDCLLLDLGGMTGLDFDAVQGVVTVEPGVTQEALARFLDEDPAGPHPFLVPVTGAGPGTSLLSNALERGYGVTPIVDHFAAVTDIEAVLADGTVYRGMLREAAGPELARLFRWGLGPQTMGLFTQSGFGVVTRMSILLARRPQALCVGLFSLRDAGLLGPAVEAIRDILQRTPGVVGAINLMNRHRVLSMSAPYPWDALNSQGVIPEAVVEAMGREYQIFPWTGFCTLYGTPGMVRAAQREIKSRLKGLASRLMFVTPQRAQTLHALSRLLPGKMGQRLQALTGTLRKSLDLVAGRPNETALPLAYWRNRSGAASTPRDPAADGCGLLWYAPLVPMTAAAAASYEDLVRSTTARHGLEPLITFTTLSDRLFDSTVPLLFDAQAPGARERAWACYDELLHRGRERGFFPYRMPVDAMPQLRQLAPQASAFNDRLARALDPQRRVAPGRYY
ncbi:MAG: FAD-binding protein [Roseateles sp.]|uniref:FAD-binding oxidoreductase n=1 Tax=Roseateles sp. TaxID=1971397 RepID=UPI0039EABB4D